MNHEDHDEYEGHDALPRRMRLPSPLPVETEDVMTRIIGCAIAVHRALGPGFIESIYSKAMCLELEAARLAYEKERPVRVRYRGVEIPGHRIDLIVGGVVVVELKSVQRIDPVHHAQTISYMKTVGVSAGLLINFRVSILRNGLKRFVL